MLALAGHLDHSRIAMPGEKIQVDVPGVSRAAQQLPSKSDIAGQHDRSMVSRV
jgi:hypothetical protein